MANMDQTKKKIALLHRYTEHRIRETNAAFPYLKDKGIDVLTFKSFDRMSNRKKLFKSLLWLIYAPSLVFRKGYDVIYCDDSFPYYAALVKLASPKSRVIIRLGDFHLMYYTKGLTYKFFHYLEKFCWKFAHKILVISESMQEHLESEGFKSIAVLDPVEPSDFIPDPTVQQEDNIVMFHGLLTKNKNIDLMIDAAKRLPDVWFWIVGGGPDYHRLQGISGKNVVFAGWHEYKHMKTLINNCTIGLALRSDNEGNEYVVTSPYLQYAAMGKPCLVTKRKVFGKYKWQFSTVEEMVSMIKQLLKAPEEGTKLRKRILKRHNAEKIAGQIWFQLSS